MEIGKVKLKNELVLAPMAGVNSLPFRLLCREAGAGLVSTAMVDVQGFLAKPEVFGQFLKEEAPLSIQLVTPDAKLAGAVAKKLERSCQLIDLNFGCPAGSATNTGRGAALLKDVGKVGEIVKSVSEAVKVPVTAKIRLGWKKIDAVEIGKACEKNGAAAVAVHARLFGEGYGIKSRWGEIKKVKDALSVPVIGNGDVWTGADAKRLLEATGCDGVMVGRAAVGDPDIFHRILHYFRTGEELALPSGKEKLEMFLKLLGLYRKHSLKERLGEVKKQAIWFSKGLVGGAEFRRRVSPLRSVEDVEALVNRTAQGAMN